MDVIFLRRLPLSTLIGVLPHERAAMQNVYLDIECELDCHQVAQRDALDADGQGSAGLDYAALAEHLQTVARGARYQLLEALAEALASSVFAAFPQVEKLRLSLEKPGALSQTAQVGVRIERQRTE